MKIGISIDFLFSFEPHQESEIHYRNMSEIYEFHKTNMHSSWNMSENPSKTLTLNMDNWWIKEIRRLSSAEKGFKCGIIEGLKLFRTHITCPIFSLRFYKTHTTIDKKSLEEWRQKRAHFFCESSSMFLCLQKVFLALLPELTLRC